MERHSPGPHGQQHAEYAQRHRYRVAHVVGSRGVAANAHGEEDRRDQPKQRISEQQRSGDADASVIVTEKPEANAKSGHQQAVKDGQGGSSARVGAPIALSSLMDWET